MMSQFNIDDAGMCIQFFESGEKQGFVPRGMEMDDDVRIENAILQGRTSKTSSWDSSSSVSVTLKGSASIPIKDSKEENFSKRIIRFR